MSVGMLPRVLLVLVLGGVGTLSEGTLSPPLSSVGNATTTNTTTTAPTSIPPGASNPTTAPPPGSPNPSATSSSWNGTGSNATSPPPFLSSSTPPPPPPTSLNSTCVYTQQMLLDGTAPPLGSCTGPMERLAARRAALERSPCGLDRVLIAIDGVVDDSRCGDCLPGSSFLEDGACTLGQFCDDNATCRPLSEQPLLDSPCPHDVEGHTSLGWCGAGLRCVAGTCVECLASTSWPSLGLECTAKGLWTPVPHSRDNSSDRSCGAPSTKSATAAAVASILGLVLLVLVTAMVLLAGYRSHWFDVTACLDAWEGEGDVGPSSSSLPGGRGYPHPEAGRSCRSGYPPPTASYSCDEMADGSMIYPPTESGVHSQRYAYDLSTRHSQKRQQFPQDVPPQSARCAARGSSSSGGPTYSTSAADSTAAESSIGGQQQSPYHPSVKPPRSPTSGGGPSQQQDHRMTSSGAPRGNTSGSPHPQQQRRESATAFRQPAAGSLDGSDIEFNQHQHQQQRQAQGGQRDCYDPQQLGRRPSTVAASGEVPASRRRSSSVPVVYEDPNEPVTPPLSPRRPSIAKQPTPNLPEQRRTGSLEREGSRRRSGSIPQQTPQDSYYDGPAGHVSVG